MHTAMKLLLLGSAVAAGSELVTVTSLVNQYGGVYCPLNDVAGNPYCNIINTAVAVGRNLCVDGNMEAVGTTAWSSTNATLSKQTTSPHGGTQVLRVLNSTTAVGQAFQTLIQTGRTYRVQAWCRSDGTALPVLTVSNTTAFTGTNSASWQAVDVTIVVTTVSLALALKSNSSVSGQYTEWDDVTFTELNIPAYNATPSQLLTDGDMSAVGTAAWTAINSATLSKVAGYLRIARNGSATPCAAQTILDTTKVQRVYGTCRSDGTAIPIVRHGTTTIFTGTASTDPQPYDVVFIPTATDIRLGSTTNTGTQFVEFAATVVALDTGIRTGNPIVNPTFSADASWLKGSGCTIAGGIGVMTSVAAGAGFSQVSALVIGKRYLITYDLVVTSGTARVLAGSSGTGTTRSASGTYSEVLICSGSGTLLLAAVTTFTGTVGNVVVTELSPLVGLPVNGAVLGIAESNRLLISVSFDGVNDLIDLYSAQLNSVFPPDEGTLSIFAKVASSGVWTDGATRRIARFSADASNVIDIFKSNVDNTITFQIIFGGTTKTITVAGQSSTGWQHYALTWSKSADKLIAYINGAQVGSTQTGLGTWAGNIASTSAVLGALTTAAANPFSGFEAHAAFLFTPLSASEIFSIA